MAPKKKQKADTEAAAKRKESMQQTTEPGATKADARISFDPKKCTPPKRPADAPRVLPRAAEIMAETGQIYFTPPDDITMSRLGNPSACCCFAVKTHDWPEASPHKHPGPSGHVGLFGYTIGDADVLNYARLVQLGWSVCQPGLRQLQGGAAFFFSLLAVITCTAQHG